MASCREKSQYSQVNNLRRYAARNARAPLIPGISCPGAVVGGVELVCAPQGTAPQIRTPESKKCSGVCKRNHKRAPLDLEFLRVVTEVCPCCRTNRHQPFWQPIVMPNVLLGWLKCNFCDELEQAGSFPRLLRCRVFLFSWCFFLINYCAFAKFLRVITGIVAHVSKTLKSKPPPSTRCALVPWTSCTCFAFCSPKHILGWKTSPVVFPFYRSYDVLRQPSAACKAL